MIARAISLLFFAAIFAFIVNTLVIAQLTARVADLARAIDSLWVRLLLGALLLDLSKLVGLLPAAFVVRRTQTLPPLLAAMLFVLLSLAMELAVHVAIGQMWLWTIPGLLAARASLFAVMIWIISRVFAGNRPRLTET
jgi:hypothetical protein